MAAERLTINISSGPPPGAGRMITSVAAGMAPSGAAAGADDDALGSVMPPRYPAGGGLSSGHCGRRTRGARCADRKRPGATHGYRRDFGGCGQPEPARGVADLPHHFGDGRRDAIRLAAAARASAGAVDTGEPLAPRSHRARPARRILRRQGRPGRLDLGRSEEHTSELQSLMRISYAV